ncbi:MAG: MarR family winged helix-turn-helix transcriptional regulator [Myxococcota bacterium]
MDFHALHFVAEHPGCTSSQLAGALGLKKSSASTLIARLSRRGLLHRGQSKVDARAAAMTLTKAGTDLRTAIVRQDRRNMQTMLAVLGDDDGPQLVQLLEKLSHGLTQATAESEAEADGS